MYHSPPSVLPQTNFAPKHRHSQIVLGNFLATFRLQSNFFANEQLGATIPKFSIFLETLRDYG